MVCAPFEAGMPLAGTVTYWLEPFMETAVPDLPPVQETPFWSVPSLPFPELSWAISPEPSSNLQRPRRPVAGGGGGPEPARAYRTPISVHPACVCVVFRT